jgi:predicted deacylase
LKHEELHIAGSAVLPGESKIVELPITGLYTHSPLNIPVHVINGKNPGPRLFVTAAIHGNEIDGVEIIRRLIKSPQLKILNGSLIAVPVTNVYGFIYLSRYLPDHRDLNRCFPGSPNGSLASRLAHLIMQEIIKQCTHGIDLHTGTFHRSNLPQLRINSDMPGIKKLARAFKAPVIVDANIRDGSLRQACYEMGIPILVYEGGEALRFNEVSIRVGLRGILGVMTELEMIKNTQKSKPLFNKIPIARETHWIRAPHGGILRPTKKLGDNIQKGDVLGIIADPIEQTKIEVIAPYKGIVIGKTNLPLVNTGDALFHLACYKKSKAHAKDEYDDEVPAETLEAADRP